MREEELLFAVYLLLLRMQTSRDPVKMTVEFLKIKNENIASHNYPSLVCVCITT